MITSLHRFIDPANYHLQAVREAAEGEIEALTPELGIIRLGLALHAGDVQCARAIIVLLEKANREGYELFQVMTAKLILSLWSDDKAQIVAAITGWLAARRSAHSGWDDRVLDAPELQPYLVAIGPARSVEPVMKHVTVTKSDHALVRDLQAARVQAVTENLDYLREAGVTGTIKAIAKFYHITHSNHHLKEITLGNHKNWPYLIVALDGDGDVLGSFLHH